MLTDWVRLHEQLKFAHVVIFYVGRTVDKEVCIVDTCVDKGSTYCLSHVICECLPDVKV